ncbi:MAG: hypothetical protein ACOC2E_07375 [Bacteroidota bacterium]
MHTQDEWQHICEKSLFANEKVLRANRMFARYHFGKPIKSVSEWESSNRSELIWDDEKEVVCRVCFEGEEEASTKLTIEFAANGDIIKAGAYDENGKKIGRISLDSYLRFNELIEDPEIIFMADGTELLSNSPSAVAVISKEEDPPPGEPQLTAWIECLESGGSDAWYGVIEEIADKDSVEAVKKAFEDNLVGEYGKVYKDDFGVADCKMEAQASHEVYIKIPDNIQDENQNFEFYENLQGSILNSLEDHFGEDIPVSSTFGHKNISVMMAEDQRVQIGISGYDEGYVVSIFPKNQENKDELGEIQDIKKNMLETLDNDGFELYIKDNSGSLTPHEPNNMISPK